MHNTEASRVYLVGRSKARATKLIEEFQHVKPDGQAHFIQSDVSLLRDVDAACKTIHDKEEKVNLLFLSPGIATTKGRDGKLRYTGLEL